MNEYRQKAINHLKTHLGCVGYRDYLIEELDKLEKIEQIIDDYDLEAWEILEKIKEVLGMNDTKLIADTIVALQEENEKLKNKLEKIEQLINENGYIWSTYVYERLKEILEQE